MSLGNLPEPLRPLPAPSSCPRCTSEVGITTATDDSGVVIYLVRCMHCSWGAQYLTIPES